MDRLMDRPSTVDSRGRTARLLGSGRDSRISNVQRADMGVPPSSCVLATPLQVPSRQQPP
jgi:hypothetical protein